MYGAAPVKWIYFVADRSLTESTQRQSPPPPLGTVDVGGTAAVVTLGLTEGRPVPIRCLSQGGHPAPRLTVYLDRVDITDRFEASHATDVTGPRGLRTVHYRSSCCVPASRYLNVYAGRGAGAVPRRVGLSISPLPVKLLDGRVRDDVGRRRTLAALRRVRRRRRRRVRQRHARRQMYARTVRRLVANSHRPTTPTTPLISTVEASRRVASGGVDWL